MAVFAAILLRSLLWYELQDWQGCCHHTFLWQCNAALLRYPPAGKHCFQWILLQACIQLLQMQSITIMLIMQWRSQASNECNCRRAQKSCPQALQMQAHCDSFFGLVQSPVQTMTHGLCILRCICIIMAATMGRLNGSSA